MSYLKVDRQAASSSETKEAGKENNEDVEVDNSKSMLLKIATLYAEQLMSDLVLVVDGISYPAHRLILCASSEVFQVMLMNREWSEWRESRVVLTETPSAAAVFPLFLKYFYTGQIRISHQTVLPVLSLADKYNVKDLVALCLSYMAVHIPHAAKRGQLISWMQYTMACGHNEVARGCQNFVKWNLERVWSECELDELEGDTLVQLLQQSDLVLHNEMSLYQFVVRWLRKQRERLHHSEDLTDDEKRAHWNSLVPAVFSHIRFPMMCPNQLAKLLLCPLTQEHKEFFMERMAIAMSYQSGQQGGAWGARGAAQFTPRLYTEDTWGTVLAVDNFHSLPCYHTRTFIFSSRSSIADVGLQDKLTEWTVDLYPKGVWFKKSLLINWTGNFDVPEVVLRTVRIAITCQNCPEYALDDYGELDCMEEDVRVKIGILIWGVQKDVEHVAAVVERVHRFSPQNRVLNIDGALDFDELNTPLYTPPAETSAAAKRCSKCTEQGGYPEPCHLLGANRDQLRIQVVILPLTDHCVVGPDSTFS